jgi:pyruvate kinase
VKLANYLALRRRDLRPLQPALQRWGLSSLGRGESSVLPMLDAVMATLDRLCGADVPQPHPSAHRMFRGERILARETAMLFGSPPGRTTRIMVTLPPEAASDPRSPGRWSSAASSASGSTAPTICPKSGERCCRICARRLPPPGAGACGR